MIYSRFDVVLADFPFTERKGRKRRPVVVLSDLNFATEHGHIIVSMVTTASLTKWASDIPIRDYIAAGLRSPSVIRMKVFTLDQELVIGRVGTLSEHDGMSLTSALRGTLP